MRDKGSPGRRRSTLDSTAWELGAQVTVLLCGLFAMALLARSLGPAGYGQYAALITLLCWVEYGLGAFFSRATIKAVAEADDWQMVARTALRGGLYLGVLFGAGLALLAWPLAVLLDMQQYTWLIVVVAIDVPVFLRAQIHLQILAGLHSFRARSLGYAARALSRLLLILLVVHFGGGVAEAALTWMGASLTELLVVRSLSGLRLQGPRFRTRALAITSVPLFVAAVCLKLTDGLDLIIVKAATDDEVAGWYAGAVNLALVPAFLGMALMPVILSSVSARRKREGATAAASSGTTWIRFGILVLPVAAVGVSISVEVTSLVLGERFARSADFLPLLLTACVGRVWLALGTAFLAGLDLAGMAARFAAGYLLLSPLGVIGGLIVGGVVGAAAGYALAAWTGVGVLLTMVIFSRSVSIPWASAARALIAVVVVLWAGTYFPPSDDPISLSQKMLVLFAVGGLVLLGLGELGPSDRQFLFQRKTAGLPVAAPADPITQLEDPPRMENQ